VKKIRDFAASLLMKRHHSHYSVKQWTELADHEQSNVRQWAMEAFNAEIATVHKELRTALDILDSDWPEVRSFGMKYFLANFNERDWTTELLIKVCDNEHEEVQQFGCELILEYFQEAQGVDYLIKLSQHPSNRIKTFVTSFLDRYARGHPERLKALRPYFVGVLRQIGGSRELKDKVLHYLHTEALNSAEAAAIVGSIYARQLNTCVRKDQFHYIESLTELAKRYPDQDWPIEIVTGEDQKPVEAQSVEDQPQEVSSHV
jgi:hypothetical protein